MSFYPSSPWPLPMTVPYATTLAGMKMDPSSLSWNHWLFLTLTFCFIYKGFLKRHPVSCLPFYLPIPVPSCPLVSLSRGKGKGRKRKRNTETDTPPQHTARPHPNNWLLLPILLLLFCDPMDLGGQGYCVGGLCEGTRLAFLLCVPFPSSLLFFAPLPHSNSHIKFNFN